MSFWVSLNDKNGNSEEVEKFKDGGTYNLHGSDEASLNITYNYSTFYYEHLNADNGLRWLDKKTAKNTIEALEYAVDVLGTSQDSDYWSSTPGNAGYALSILLSWAKQYPESRWRVN
jgi:hypothetical protein